MSLTSRIDDPKSTVGRFFRERMLGTRRVVSRVNASLKDAPTIQPAISAERPPYMLLGIAIDYRIRYYFPAGDYHDLTAWHGAVRLSGQPIWTNGKPSESYPLSPDGQAAVEEDGVVYIREAAAPAGLSLPKEVIEGFFSDLAMCIDEIAPEGRRLEQEQEVRLNRYCVILALFEEVARAGPRAESLLFRTAVNDVEDLLTIAQSHWIEDLSAQSKAFCHCFEDKFRSEHVLNPKFAGSSDVGGADGDLIIESSLLDVKSTTNPRINGAWLYQLIGYALLDYEDQYGLTNAGIYLTRQGRLVDWEIQSLIDDLMPNPQTLNELRLDFRDVCSRQTTEC